MRTRSGFGSRLLASVALLAGLVGVGVAEAAPAQALTWRKCSWTADNPEDPGGTNAIAYLSTASSCNGQTGDNGYYYLHFNSHGEVLSVTDGKADGHAAKAIAKVYDRSGRLVDTDTFRAATKDGSRKFDLGTPDGSGNIAEGYKVHVQICINDTTTCSTIGRGVA